MPFNTRNTGDRPKKIRILGYRSGTSSKMFIASIVYILLFLLLFRTILPTSTFNVFMSIGIIGFLLSILALIIGLIKPSIVLPKAEYKTRKKAVYYYSFSFIAFLLLAIFFTVEEPISAEKSAVTKCESSETRSEITQLAEKKSKLEEDIKKLNKEKEKLSAETQKLAREKKAQKLAEEKRKEKKAQKLAEEKRKEKEAKKLAEEKRKEKEAKKLAEEKRKEKEAKKLAEEKRKEEEAKKLAEEKRKEEEAQKLAEEKRKEEEAQKLAEEKRKEEEAAALAKEQEDKQTSVTNTNVYYENCTAARAAGAAPVYEGQPGYAKHLDRDGDGIGCDQ